MEQVTYSGGFAFGKFLSDNSKTFKKVGLGLLYALILALTIALLWNAYNDMVELESTATMYGATTAYMSMAYHQGCKRRGACCRSCPFINEDDPRMVISNQVDLITELYRETQANVSDDTLMVANAIDNISDSAKAATASTTWQGILANEVNASQSISIILSQLKTLDATFGETSSVNVALIDAKNKATALSAAAAIQKNILIVASLHLHAQIMMQYIMDVSADKQQKILDYDQLVATAAMSANTSTSSIANIYATSNATSANYTAAYNAMSPAATTTSQDIIASMATLISEAQAGDDSIKSAIAKLSNVSRAYHACRNVIDRFSNDLPGKMTNDRMTTLIESNDYESAIIQTALEPDLVSNHKKFAKERSSFESGGGIQSVRDDDNDVVPWVGVFGRPTYRKSNGASIDISTGASNEANVLKSIPSDVPTQLMRKSSIRLGTTTY